VRIWGASGGQSVLSADSHKKGASLVLGSITTTTGSVGGSAGGAVGGSAGGSVGGSACGPGPLFGSGVHPALQDITDAIG